MNFLVQLVIQILIAIVVSELTAKKPQTNVKAKGLDVFKFPTVSSDRAIPYICGDVLLESPNVTWYGDLLVNPLKKKVKSGLFSSSKITVGFEYYLGMELALCWGEVDEINQLYLGKELAFTGAVTDDGTGTEFTVDAKEIFGGQKNGGGVFANCVFYKGSQSQIHDSYMATQVNDNFRHQGLAKIIWKGPSDTAGFLNPTFLAANTSGLISESENIHPVKVRVKRFPNELGSSFKNINGAANPAEVIYEIMIGRHINLAGKPTAPYMNKGDIDTVNFLVAASTLSDEGMGISFQWQADTIIDDILSDIEEHIEAKIVEDPITGLIQLKLLRDDYDLNAAIAFDESSIVGFNNYSTSAETTLTNEVIATYTKTGNLFKPEPIAIQNSGNLFSQDNISTMNLDLSMFTDPIVAQKRAFTELQKVSNPLKSGQFIADRSAWQLKIGDVVKLSYEEHKIVGLAARVTKIDYGNIVKREMIISFVEDVFSLGSNIYPDPIDSNWVDPNSVPVAIANPNIFEMPKRLLDTSLPNQIGIVATRPAGTVYEYETYISLDGGINYSSVAESAPFSDAGQLTIVLSADTEYTLANGITFRLPEGFETFDNPNVPDATFQNFVLVNNEIMAYDSLIDNLDGTVTTTNLFRGLLDTVPSSHSINDLVVPISDIRFLDTEFQDDQDLDFKFLTLTWSGVLTLAAAPNEDYLVVNREQLPYPPADLQINGEREIPSIFSGDTTITWKNRDKDNNSIFNQQDSQDAGEVGVLPVVEVYDALNVLIHTEDPATSPFVYTLNNELEDSGQFQSQLTIKVYSKRAATSEVSLQSWSKVISKEAPNTPPNAGFNYSSNDREITFTDISVDPDGTIVSWLWDFGDTNTSTSQNPINTYSTNGTYTITLTVTDDDGDTGQIVIDILATDVNKLPIADFNYSDAGTTVNFTDLSTDEDGTVDIWAWDFGDANTSTSQNPVNIYSSTGVYSVTLTVTDNESGVSLVKSKTIGVGVDFVTILDLPGNDATLNKIDDVDGRVFIPEITSEYPSLVGTGWGGPIAGATKTGMTLNSVQLGSIDLAASLNSGSKPNNTYSTVELPANDDIKQLMTVLGDASWSFEVWTAGRNFEVAIIDTANSVDALRIKFNLAVIIEAAGRSTIASFNGGSNGVKNIVITHDANIPETKLYLDGTLFVGTSSNTNIVLPTAPLGVNEYKIAIGNKSLTSRQDSCMANMKFSLGVIPGATVLTNFNADSGSFEGNTMSNVSIISDLAVADVEATDIVGTTAGFELTKVSSSSDAVFKVFSGSDTPINATSKTISNAATLIRVEQVSGDPVLGSLLNTDIILTPSDPTVYYVLKKPSLSGAGTLTATLRVIVTLSGVEHVGEDIVLTCTHTAASSPPALGTTTDLDEAIIDAGPTQRYKMDETSGLLYTSEAGTSWLSASQDIVTSLKTSLRQDGLGNAASVTNNASTIISTVDDVNVQANFTVEFGQQLENTLAPGFVYYTAQIGDQFVVNGETQRGAVSLFFTTTTVNLRIFYTIGAGPIDRLTVTVTQDFVDGSNHWITIRRNGIEISVFIDGVLIASTNIPIGAVLAGDSIAAMEFMDRVNEAKIDDISYYAKALHINQIDRNSQYFLTGSYTP